MTTDTYSFRCPAAARALGFESGENGLVGRLEAAGLVITDTGVQFPAGLLNSVTALVTEKWEIIDGEDRRWLDSSEINEMNALKRLLDRLHLRGGVDKLDPKYEEDASLDVPVVRNEQWSGTMRDVKIGQRWTSEDDGEFTVLAIGEWAARVRWSGGQEGSVRFWQFTEEFTLIEEGK